MLDRSERRTKTGSKMGVIQLSDPTGQYEAIIFQEGLTQYRDLLEKGSDVLVTLQANVEGEDVRARIVHVESLNAGRRQGPQGPARVRPRRGAAALDRGAPARAGAKAKCRWS